MGNTANYQFPYPELSDPPNVPSDMRALADAVDSRVKAATDANAASLAALTTKQAADHASLLALVADSGWVAPATYGNGYTGYTGGGWTGVVSRKYGNVVVVTGAVFRQGGYVGAAACQLIAGHRPTRQLAGANCIIDTGGNLIPDQFTGSAVHVTATFIAG